MNTQESPNDDSSSSERRDHVPPAIELPCKWIAAALSGHEPCPSNKGNFTNDTAVSLQKEKWSGMRLVDAVVLNDSGDVENWVFTAKTGHITSKKKTQDLVKIAERFERFALANPRNTERYVALVSNYGDRGCNSSERIALDEVAFREAMAGSQVPQELLGATLQCYLRPQNGSNFFLRGCYRGCDQLSTLVKVSPLYRLPGEPMNTYTGKNRPMEDFPVPGDSPEAIQHTSDTQYVLTSLVEFLQRQLFLSNERQVICECDADFIIDDNGELWLTSLPRVAVTQNEGGNAAQSIPDMADSSGPISGEVSKISREAYQHSDNGSAGDLRFAQMPPLGITPSQVAPLDGGGSPLGRARLRSAGADTQPASSTRLIHAQQVDEDMSLVGGALPAISTLFGARSTPGDHNKFGVKQGQTPPIIERKGGIYIANVHASALRGLCCWREYPGERRGALRNKDSPRWQLVEGRYKGNLAGEDRSGDDPSNDTAVGSTSPLTHFNELSKARFKMITRSVLLAIAATSFLRGDEPFQAVGSNDSKSDDNGTSLAQRWREHDQRAQLSSASTNPQAYYAEATVCGNCMEICRKLDSIRNSGFPDSITVTARSPTNGVGLPRPSSEPLPESTPLNSGKLRPSTTNPESGDAGEDQRETGGGNSARKPDSSSDSITGRDGLENTHLCPVSQNCKKGNGVGDNSIEACIPGPRVEAAVNDDGKATLVKSDILGVVEATRAGDKKNTTLREKVGTTKALNRVSGVYRDDPKLGIGKLKGSSSNSRVGAVERRGKTRLNFDSTASNSSSTAAEELPSVAALARFAIEREQLAREMGVDELGGPATSGVVNVSALAQGRGRNGKGTGGGKRAKNLRQGWSAGDCSDGEGSEGGAFQSKRYAPMGGDSRFAGEMLLEKLESVAEARSMEQPTGTQNDDEEQISHDDWCSEAPSRFNDHERGGWGLPSPVGELSTTESAFLERSRLLGLEGSVSGIKSNSLFGDHFEEGFRDGGGRGGENGGGGSGYGNSSVGGNVATISALRDRLATVEGENTALRARAHRAEEERATEATRGDKAVKKLAQARMEFARAMSEKDEDYSRKELALEERHSRELATRSQVSAEEMVQQSSGEQANQGGDGLASKERASSKNLIIRLEQALKEMAEQQRRFAHAKRILLAEKTQEIAATETKGRCEVQQSRSLAAAMEDRASSLQEQVSEAAKQISTLKAREDDQNKRRKAAEEESDKIRKDISILRQTVHASQSMDLTDESGGRRDGKSALAAVTATSEARIRTLNNKVEFLKAQLASEQTLKAEVEAALAVSRKSLFEAKDESRKKAAEAEKAKETAVEGAVFRIQRQVEESMSETYRVQCKVQTLQDQLSDALGDLSMVRRREEAMKVDLTQTAAKLEDRGAELAKAQSRADDLAEARAADTESSADRAAREAVVRRLDNERQYLKSQLQSEITCKDELREALTRATGQLGEMKADWAEEQMTRTEEFQRKLQVNSEKISDQGAEKAAMEAELVVATQQLGLLREGYSKARDTLRAEQLALETARTANRRLREEIKASAEELAAIKTQQGEDVRRHSQSLVAAKTALDEADESKRKQGLEYEVKLRKQLLRTSEVQQQLMVLQTELAGRERTSSRLLAVERLGQGLVRWSKNRKASAFYRITNGVAMLSAENDVRERTRRALREAGEGARRIQEAAVEEARTRVILKADEELAEAERVASAERVALLEDAETAAAVAATQVQAIEELQALEASTRSELEKTRTETKESLRTHREQMGQATKKAEEQALARIEAAVSRAQETCAEASSKGAEESDERWRVVLREHLDKAGEKAAAMAAAVSRERDMLLEETQLAFRGEREKLQKKGEFLATAAVEKERECGLEREAEARAIGVAEAEATAARAREEDRLAAEDSQSVALAEAAAHAEAAALVARSLDQVAKTRAEIEAAAERAKLEKELAKARERAVKLEGGKWQKASEEAEARAAAEQAAAYERGLADRGRRADAEAVQLQEAAEKALEEVKQGARATIEEMSARHMDELEAEKRRVSDEEALVREKTLEAARLEWTEQQIKTIANAKAAATAEARARAERERTAAVEAAKERERLMTEKVQDELRRAKTEWATERRRLKEQATLFEEAEQKVKDELLRAMVNSSQATQRARARWEEGQKVAMEKAAAQAVEDKEKALEDGRRSFNREKKRALLENQEAFSAQAEVMADRLREEAKESLQKADALCASIQQERDNLASELEDCRRGMKENEASIMNLQEDAKEQSVSHSTQTWRLAASFLKRHFQHKKAMEQLGADAAEREMEAELASEEQKKTLSAVVEELIELAYESRRRFDEMQETLVNHKREVLIDHKVQSASLHKELDTLARDREQLEDQRVVSQREFRELEGQAKEAEKETHSHSRQSAIGPDGMIIPARARKKRRLDEELEGLLEVMETKRKALAVVNGRLADLAELRSTKDDEMKSLERDLVQVLVEQQKKLLVLLGEAGKQAEQLEDINSRARFARNETKLRVTQARRKQQKHGGAGG